jgi:hypothetical protein
MGFLQSAINQVGRDMGRVVSNSVFKDRHAIPIRRARSYGSNRSQTANTTRTSSAQPIQEVKDEFDKSIDFKTDYKPVTLISKLGGAFIVIKNEAKSFIDDGYLDVNESQQLFEMMKRFNDKCGDVEDVMSFTEDEDSKPFEQLEKIHQSTQEIFKAVLDTSSKACIDRALHYENEANNVHIMSFGKYVGLHLIWMPNYAKGNPKHTTKAIVANVLDVITLTFPFTRTVLFILGVVTYSGEKKELQETMKRYKNLANHERERAKAYREMVAKG